MKSFAPYLLLSIYYGLITLGCSEPASTRDSGTDGNSSEDARHADIALEQSVGITDAETDQSASLDTTLDINPLADLAPDYSLPPGTHPDIVKVIEVIGCDPGEGWSDSYSVGDQCYCETTFDHDIGDVEVETPVGTRTVRQICDALGPGPGSEGRPVYNDIQCGNGPPNSARGIQCAENQPEGQGDEHFCPGRVDIGREGCGHIGPKWDLSEL